VRFSSSIDICHQVDLLWVFAGKTKNASAENWHDQKAAPPTEQQLTLFPRESDRRRRMNNHRRTATSLAAAQAALLCASAAVAQTPPAPAAAASAPRTEKIEAVVITGQRAALQSAQKIKQNADEIVDSIVADTSASCPTSR
jgi:hypothetical protein